MTFELLLQADVSYRFELGASLDLIHQPLRGRVILDHVGCPNQQESGTLGMDLDILFKKRISQWLNNTS